MFRQNVLFVLVSAILATTVTEADYPLEEELRRSPEVPRRQPEVSCGQRASCGVANANARLPFYTRNCFCDALCRVYDDCCADFRPQSTETGTGNSLLNLPRSAISCARVEEIDTAYEIYIVTKCPRGFSNRFIRDRCEDERISGEFYRLPVSGVTSGVLYRNAYCAMCANETAFLFWRMAHLCVGVGGGAPDVRQMMTRCPPELLAPEVSGDGDATSGERLRPRKCKSHVSQCEPRRRGKGGRGRRRCRGPTSYVYDGLQVGGAYVSLSCKLHLQPSSQRRQQIYFVYIVIIMLSTKINVHSVGVYCQKNKSSSLKQYGNVLFIYHFYFARGMPYTLIVNAANLSTLVSHRDDPQNFFQSFYSARLLPSLPPPPLLCLTP